MPLSPALIFGLGPLPQLGIAGGAVAVLALLRVGSARLRAYLWSGRGVLQPRCAAAAAALGADRATSCASARSPSLVSVSTNITIAHRDRLRRRASAPAAVAGYGTGARLEYLLVPLVFGLGAPLAAMVGTASAPASANGRCASPGPAPRFAGC